MYQECNMLRWLRSNDFLNNRELNTTHTLMTGGVVGVPDEHYDEFLGLYAAEVKSKNATLSFSELRSDPVFYMYFDIDLLDTCVTDAEVSSRIFSTLQRVVKSYYGSDRNDDCFRFVVCDTPTKQVSHEWNGQTSVLTKNGFHITLPNLKVTLEQALQIRYSAVYELEKSMGSRPEGLNAWSDVIDRAPYTSGLKMCGSFKSVRCTDCKKSDPTFKEKKKELLSKMAKVRRKIFPREAGFDYSDLGDIHADEFKDVLFGDMYGKYLEFTGYNACRVCLNKGSVVENRTYMPSLVLDGAGDTDTSLLDVFREDYYEVMKYTSIRCQEGESATAGFKIPRGVPKPPTEDNGANMRTFSSKKLLHLGGDMHAFTVNNDIYLSDAQTMHMWKGPRVEDEKRLATIEKFIRENICNVYSQVHIRKVFESQITRKVPPKSSSGMKMINSMVGAHSGTQPPQPSTIKSNRYLVNIAGVGSTYCMNKGSEHTSNSVYFIITKDCCFQRCFSKKPEIRKGGTTCAEYKSGSIAVPRSVSSVLFPDEAVRGTCSDRQCQSVSSAKAANKRKKHRSINWGMKKL